MIKGKPYKLFLDDKRDPENCVHYMYTRIGQRNPIYLEEDWVIVRNIGEFISTIQVIGLPEFISFDHDLRFEHYQISCNDLALDPGVWESFDDTGYDCAVWLIDYCKTRGIDLPYCAVHSMSQGGAERTFKLLCQNMKK